MALTNGQNAALAELDRFLASSDVSFALQGGAGVGKTYLVSQFVQGLLSSGRRVVIAAPTHKACRVLRAKLSDAGIRWVFKPASDAAVPANVAVVDTTAALLGVRPVIVDEQSEDELSFATLGNGSLSRSLQLNGSVRSGAVLIVDEVSMVGRDDLQALVSQLKVVGAKLVAVGDDGQLPPVKKVAIDFENDFDRAFLLDEVVRQAKGSAIVSLAWAIRSSSDTDEAEAALNEHLSGSGISKADDVVSSFLSAVEQPVDDEGQRAVFIAYRNATVNAVQEKACRKLYGHGRRSFRAGELVLSTTAGYAEVFGTYRCKYTGRERPSKFPKLVQLVAVADQLRVLSFDESRRDPTFGVPVTLDRVDLPADAANKVFDAHYLSEEELGDESHPFNVKKAELLKAARELQEQFNAAKKGNQGAKAAQLDGARKEAWQAFFKHEQAVLSFAHPFAITSHKSQGSTYREVFVHAPELLRFNRKALYVAVTRPSKQLWL